MYNIQMTRPRFLTALTFCALAGAVGVPTVSAYLSPEEVLTGASYDTSAVNASAPSEEDEEYKDWEAIEEETTGEELPSGIRPRRPVIDYRDQPSKNNHATLKKYQSSSSAATEAAAPVIEEEPPPEEEASATITLDQKTIRLLERLTNRPSQNAQPNAVAEHTGAPLSPTGPATLVAMLAILAAIAWTVRRAGKAEATTEI